MTGVAVFFAAAVAAGAAFGKGLRHGPLDEIAQGWASAALILFTLLFLLLGEWGWAAFSAVFAAITGGSWWNRRGRRAAWWLGAKSRALVAALVRALKPAPRPRPVRSPA